MLSFWLNTLKRILNIGKKIILVISVYFVVISLFLYFINKDKPRITYDPIQKNRDEIYKIINDKKLNSTKEGKLTVTIYRAMICGFIGEACSDNPDDGDQNYNKSILGFMGNLIVLPYANPPASGVYWAYSGLQNAGFIPKTYAAEGIGFAAIRGYITIWDLFRNLSYLILVIIIISIGFMIMFRFKLNPQTVISVENALPRIVISLILITFSFSIAGFLIDIMYVIIALAIYILSQAKVGDLTPTKMLEFQNTYMGASLFNAWPYGSGLSAFSAGNALYHVLPDTLRFFLQGIVSSLLTFWFVRFTSDSTYGKIIKALRNLTVGVASFVVGTGQLADIIAVVIDFILFFIILAFMPAILLGIGILITLLFLMFRIFFLLLTSYIKIIIYIIFSPIILLFEAFPGRNVFGWWLKNLFAELIAFPAVVILSLIGYMIVQINMTTKQPFSLPFLGGFSASDFGIIIGLALVMLTPDLIKTLRELLGAKGLPVSVGLGTLLGGVGTAGGGLITGLSTFGSLTLAVPRLRGLAGRVLPFLSSPEQATDNTLKTAQERIRQLEEQIAQQRPKPQ